MYFYSIPGIASIPILLLMVVTKEHPFFSHHYRNYSLANFAMVRLVDADRSPPSVPW